MTDHPPTAVTGQAAAAPSGTPGIAIASLVTSIAGFCLPLVGIVGIVLGILGLRAAKARNAGQGVAIAGIVVGVVTTLLALLLIPLQLAMLLPAIAQARTAAREVKASTELSVVGQMVAVARNDGVAPNRGDNFESALDGYVAPQMWTTDLDDGSSGETDYLLHYGLVESTAWAGWPTEIVLNPNLGPGIRNVPVLRLDDGSVQMVDVDEALRMLAEGETYMSDGRRWASAER